MAVTCRDKAKVINCPVTGGVLNNAGSCTNSGYHQLTVLGNKMNKRIRSKVQTFGRAFIDRSGRSIKERTPFLLFSSPVEPLKDIVTSIIRVWFELRHDYLARVSTLDLVISATCGNETPILVGSIGQRLLFNVGSGFQRRTSHLQQYV